MTREQLTKLMEQIFGPDWKDKTVVTPVSSFRLIDVYEECGMAPAAEVQAERRRYDSYGVWQILR